MSRWVRGTTAVLDCFSQQRNAFLRSNVAAYITPPEPLPTCHLCLLFSAAMAVLAARAANGRFAFMRKTVPRSYVTPLTLVAHNEQHGNEQGMLDDAMVTHSLYRSGDMTVPLLPAVVACGGLYLRLAGIMTLLPDATCAFRYPSVYRRLLSPHRQRWLLSSSVCIYLQSSSTTFSSVTALPTCLHNPTTIISPVVC